jgi:hypothetical protein
VSVACHDRLPNRAYEIPQSFQKTSLKFLPKSIFFPSINTNGCSGGSCGRNSIVFIIIIAFLFIGIGVVVVVVDVIIAIIIIALCKHSQYFALYPTALGDTNRIKYYHQCYNNTQYHHIGGINYQWKRR